LQARQVTQTAMMITLAAVVQALFPGEEGGSAIAGVLSGRVVPSGRLPAEMPASAGRSHPPTGRRRGRAAVPERPGSPGRAAGALAGRLRPGAAGTRRGTPITFRLHADRTAFTGRAGTRIVEPGEIGVAVGGA
jgi:glycosyl hydrolase family 3